MKDFRPRKATFIALLFFAATQSIATAETTPPNIIIVLCDDLGYGDIGCYGHDVIKTPHLDKFAKQGLKLTDCYAAAPNCSPARTGLMTGRTPSRVGVYSWIPFLSPMHVRETEITIAHRLKDAGYETCQVGKWHLNGWFNLPGQPQPSDMGFDHWFATQNNALPNHRNPYNFVRNGIPAGPLEGYASHLVTDEAINWLDHRDEKKPFFMYVCYHEPHEPIATDPEYAALYGNGDKPSLEAHHGNITQMDTAFGRLMKKLETLNLEDNTLVIFTSDNGPAMTRIHPHGSTDGLRKYKGHLYEGGIRVPGLVRWPGHVKPGTTSDVPVSAVDFLPTLCEVAGTTPPTDRVLDGTSVLPVFHGKNVTREKPLYWQFNYAKSDPRVVIRDGDWKLLSKLDLNDQGNLTDITDQQMQQFKTAKLQGFELYNLKQDRNETTDLSKTNPQQLNKMVAAMTEIYTQVQQEGPTWPAWTWPRYEGQRIEWPSYRGK
ncbi:sulfatase [Thalassoglobus sp.]|uniref:sulfatase n=1 Tax=Thalassoglobus sp. TaxID=2795869 RepID=UPI003AA94A43